MVLPYLSKHEHTYELHGTELDSWVLKSASPEFTLGWICILAN
jgi:hypothetical protein